MRSRFLTALIAGTVAASLATAASADRPKPAYTPTVGEDVRPKPDGWVPDVPRVPDDPSPNVDTPGPDRDPGFKPDGWVPDTPRVPD
ncbi:hypothetical protein P8Q88_11010 [Qipengyuania sp. XHP0207]|uniref:hypothetical protein n=1 Tax=Qipengyuania sp. XHP0207 TaxID=3038078 RepID=UPI00241F1998|nr:hypothetical protein [Qipengyuania sp. XHP0207]MDG5748704.1 hypothetical protein [Qipengyuania sp. XHP0207]